MKTPKEVEERIKILEELVLIFTKANERAYLENDSHEYKYYKIRKTTDQCNDVLTSIKNEYKEYIEFKEKSEANQHEILAEAK